MYRADFEHMGQVHTMYSEEVWGLARQICEHPVLEEVSNVQ